MIQLLIKKIRNRLLDEEIYLGCSIKQAGQDYADEGEKYSFRQAIDSLTEHTEEMVKLERLLKYLEKHYE